jgi:hypothetical protein
MDILDKITELTGLKFEDLNQAERETAMNWVTQMAEREITLEDIKSFILSMRQAVDNELAIDNLSKNRDLYLKARLKNLILFEAFLTSPEKAKKALELYLKKLKV